jgi:hypothetical protein
MSLRARRAARREEEVAAQERAARKRRAEEVKAALARGEVLVNRSLLVRNSYSPDFVMRGTYRAVEFACRGCAKVEIWTPAQQKWWYEIAKGDVNSTAVMCRTCRRKERERRAEARRVHLEGVARKRGEGLSG